jgi:arabinose-5-phosphate isomerase
MNPFDAKKPSAANIIALAQQTIAVEIETLQNLAFDQDFVAVVQLIAQSRGRVVVTGIGKSAIVAQKIVATLNSTGTPSVFMHAADAIHGDLGIIQPHDIVICISKSGDTPEIKVLVPLLKNFGNPLVAMVSNRQSQLGRSADWVLHTPVAHEVDPNNLASNGRCYRHYPISIKRFFCC